MIYYFDSSAIVKLYVPEPGSQWVENITQLVEAGGEPVNLIVFALIGVTEVSAAIARRQRMGDIRQTEREMLFNRFMGDYHTVYTTLALTDAVIRQAAELAQVYSLRGYDAMHLAAALKFNDLLHADDQAPLTFVSADDNLLLAASRAGLPIENPSHHA